MDETSEVLPACEWPTTATLRILGPSKTFKRTLLFPGQPSNSGCALRAPSGSGEEMLAQARIAAQRCFNTKWLSSVETPRAASRDPIQCVRLLTRVILSGAKNLSLPSARTRNSV